MSEGSPGPMDFASSINDQKAIQSLLATLQKEAGDILPEVISHRRWFHRHPEVSYREFETTQCIVDTLMKLGIDVHRPLETGCVGVIQGERPGPVVALRADIDALPIQEKGDAKKKFLSEVPGVAHCCGHDAHTATLIGAATLIQRHREELTGTVLLIFQPGEETLPGGARMLMESGFLRKWKVSRIFGLHSAPMLPVGVVGLKSGLMMARPDEFEATLIGKGGHAAMPHLAIDPIVMAAHAIQAIQTISSRISDPTEPVVVTVGSLHAGTAHNVIPDTALLKGTVRTFTATQADRVKKKIDDALKSASTMMGGSYLLTYRQGYPAVINDPEATQEVSSLAEKLLGSKAIQPLDRPLMIGEDFSYYLQQIPGSFFLLGTGSEEADSCHDWHHPKFNIDERALETGVAMMTSLAFLETMKANEETA